MILKQSLIVVRLRLLYGNSVSRVAFLERDKNFVKTPNWRIFVTFSVKSGNSGAEFLAISRNFSYLSFICFWCFHEKFDNQCYQIEQISPKISSQMAISRIFWQFSNSGNLVTLCFAKVFESDHYQSLFWSTDFTIIEKFENSKLLKIKFFFSTSKLVKSKNGTILNFRTRKLPIQNYLKSKLSKFKIFKIKL